MREHALADAFAIAHLSTGDDLESLDPPPELRLAPPFVRQTQPGFAVTLAAEREIDLHGLQRPIRHDGRQRVGDAL